MNKHEYEQTSRQIPLNLSIYISHSLTSEMIGLQTVDYATFKIVLELKIFAFNDKEGSVVF